ncbi:hypothetical protein HAX54_011763, partial [Datura stramonium]|nr:hypothetical protein [Datura stramonium]
MEFRKWPRYYGCNLLNCTMMVWNGIEKSWEEDRELFKESSYDHKTQSISIHGKVIRIV